MTRIPLKVVYIAKTICNLICISTSGFKEENKIQNLEYQPKKMLSQLVAFN